MNCRFMIDLKKRLLDVRSRWNSFLAKLAVGWLITQLLTPAFAQENIRGQAGTATARDSSDFSELARQQTHAPVRVAKKPRPIRKPVKRVHRSPPTPIESKSLLLEAQNSPLAAASIATPSIPSPLLSASFAALGDDGTERTPDTEGAVGPNHLMVTLNSQVRIQDRSGAVLSTLTLDGWWASFGASNVFDPRVLYDPYGQRWIFSAVGDRQTLSGVLVAVSQTSDPGGNWNRYFVSTAPVDAGAPNVGFSTNWIVVQVNTYDNSSGFDGSS